MNRNQRSLTENSLRQVNSLLAFLIHGKSRLCQHFTKWCIKGPAIGADASTVAMVLEESGHRSILQTLAKDPIFNDFEPPTFTFLNKISDSWEEFIANILIYDQFLESVFQASKHSSFTPLQEGVPKIIEEEKFHRQFALEWARILGTNDKLKQDWNQYVEKAVDELGQNLSLLQCSDLKAEGVISEGVNEIYETLRDEVLRQCAEWKQAG